MLMAFGDESQARIDRQRKTAAHEDAANVSPQKLTQDRVFWYGGTKLNGARSWGRPSRMLPDPEDVFL